MAQPPVAEEYGLPLVKADLMPADQIVNNVLKLVLPIRVPLAVTRLWPEIAPIMRSPTNAQGYPMIFLEIAQIGSCDQIGAIRPMELCALEPVGQAAGLSWSILASRSFD
jgi:hypothetical protein